MTESTLSLHHSLSSVAHHSMGATNRVPRPHLGATSRVPHPSIRKKVQLTEYPTTLWMPLVEYPALLWVQLTEYPAPLWVSLAEPTMRAGALLTKMWKAQFKKQMRISDTRALFVAKVLIRSITPRGLQAFVFKPTDCPPYTNASSKLVSSILTRLSLSIKGAN
jgi:hypothetical protein